MHARHDGLLSRLRSWEHSRVGRSRQIERPVASEAGSVWMITFYGVRVAATGGADRVRPQGLSVDDGYGPDR